MKFTRPLFIVLCLIASSSVSVGPALDKSTPFGVIDDTYGVNALGSYNHVIPIDVPSGVNGLVPKLAISYDSKSGSSRLGLGWNLSGLSRIVRAGNNYAQHGRSQGITFSSQDAFLLDGQYLTCVRGLNGASDSEYRTESESFAKVYAIGELSNSEASPNTFIVKYPNGRTYHYGTTADSKLEISFSDTKNEILEWHLTRIEDQFGNYAEFRYSKEAINTIRIASILYTGNVNGKAPTNKLVFTYDEEGGKARKTNETYIAGIRFLDQNLLKSIGIDSDGNDFKYYHMNYDSTFTKLVSVSESTDQDNEEHIPPTNFNYYDRDTLKLDEKSSEIIPYLQAENKLRKQLLVDIDGDGNTENLVFRNHTDNKLILEVFGKEEIGYTKRINTITLENKYPDAKRFNWVGLLDINGDGKTDFHTSQGVYKYEEKDGKPNFTFVATDLLDNKAFYHFTGADGEINVSDFNGDGKDEVILLNKTTGVHLLLEYSSEGKLATQKIDGFTGKYTSIKTANFRQGESQDLILVNAAAQAGHLSYKGGKYLYRKFSFPALPSTTFNNNQIQFRDVNLDGLDDIVLLSTASNNNKLPISINKGSIDGKPAFENYPAAAALLSVAPEKISAKTQFGNYVNSGYLEVLIPKSDKDFRVYSVRRKDNVTSLQKEPEQLLKLPDFTDLKLTGTNYGFVDKNSDGLVDLYVDKPNTDQLKSERHWFLNKELFYNRLSSSIDGFSNKTKVIYTSTKDTDVYSCTNAQLAENYEYANSALAVVKKLHYSNGLDRKQSESTEPVPYASDEELQKFKGDSLNHTSYRYEDLIYEHTGRGMAGFRKVTKTDNTNDIKKEMKYEYEFPFTGRISEENRFTAEGVNFFNQENDWGVKLYKKSAAFAVANPQLVSLLANQSSDEGLTSAAAVRDAGKLLQELTANPTTTSNRLEFDEINVNLSVPRLNGKIAKAVTNFNTSGVRYLPILNATTITKRELNGAELIKSTVEFTYNALGQVTDKKTIFGDKSTSNTHTEYRDINSSNLPSSLYILGLPSLEQSFMTSGAGEKSTTRSVNYEYNEKGMPNAKIREKGKADLEKTTAFKYDTRGNLVQKQTFQREENVLVEKFTYSPDGRFVVASENALGQKTHFEFDKKFGNVIWKKDPNGLVTSYQYDAFGTLQKISHADGQVTLYDHSFVVRKDLHIPNADAVLYQVKRSIPGGEDLIDYYDKAGRKIASIYYMMDTNSYKYAHFDRAPTSDTNNSLVYERKPIGGSIRRPVLKEQRFDKAGNVKVDVQPRYLQMNYDPSGVQRCYVSEQNELFFDAYEYDDFNRLTLRRLADGKEVRIEYEANKKTVTNTSGQKTVTRYNQKGEPVSIDDMANNRLSYSYDLWGNVTSIRNPYGAEIETKYDGLGRKTEVFDANIGTVAYRYDEFDRQVLEITNGIKEVKLSYDPLSRIVERESKDGITKWSYDGNFVGRVDSVVVQNSDRTTSSSENFSYDQLGRLTSTTQSIDGKIFEAKVGYDQYSRISEKTFPGGYKIRYNYSNNLLSSISDAEKVLFKIDDLSATGQPLKKSYGNGLITIKSYNQQNQVLNQIYTYNPAKKVLGNMERILRTCIEAAQNGSETGGINIDPDIIRTIEPYRPFIPRIPPIDPRNPLNPRGPWGPSGPFGPYNAGEKGLSEIVVEEGLSNNKLARLLKKNTETAASSELEIDPTVVLQDLSFGYDDNYNLVHKVDRVGKKQEKYSYDKLNRLSQYQYLNGTNDLVKSVDIRYDDLGNITYKSDVGTYAYDEKAFQRVKHIIDSEGEFRNKFVYDIHGNVVENQVDNLKIEYTGLNKPSRLTRGELTQEFTYGSTGRRIKSKTIASDTVLIKESIRPFDDYEEVERNGKTVRMHYIIFNGQMVAIHNEVADDSEVTKTFNHFIHKDHLGSVSVITDDNANSVTSYSYDPFGKRTTTSGNSLLVSTKGFTGHDHLEAFDLVDAGGRFYDPSIGRFLSADPYIQSPNNLQSLNRYSYVMNNPLNAVDPSGYWSIGRAFRRAVRSVSRAVRNVGRALAKAVKTVVKVYVDAVEAVVDEAARFVSKYGKQIVMVAAAAAITYFSAGTLAGFGGALLQGALWGGGISAGITAANGGNFQDILNAGFNGAINGATAAAAAFAIGAGFEGMDQSIGSSGYFGKTLAHGTSGGIQAEINGGNFEQGFLGASITNAFTPMNEQMLGTNPDNAFKRVAFSAGVGGIAAQAGGGDFTKGAVMSGFVQAFNHEMHRKDQAQLRQGSNEPYKGDPAYAKAREMMQNNPFSKMDETLQGNFKDASNFYMKSKVMFPSTHKVLETIAPAWEPLMELIMYENSDYSKPKPCAADPNCT